VAAEDTLVDAGETTAQPPHVDAAQSDDAVIADVDTAVDVDGDGNGAGPSADASDESADDYSNGSEDGSE
jgi:hypothetical protein